MGHPSTLSVRKSRSLIELSPLDYLEEAADRPTKQEISADNRFREIGFDANNARLGWFIAPAWKDIEANLRKFLELAKGKENFVFIGMGGSINTVKALVEISANAKRPRVFTYDHLDPAALAEILSEVNLAKTLVVSISKSATTKETRELSKNWKAAFDQAGIPYKEHFLWLIDSPKLQDLYTMDNGAWENVCALPIQPDGKTDIGGRFTAPYTMIFFLPLLILLGKDMGRLSGIYHQHLKAINQLREAAAKEADRLFQKKTQYFAVKVAPQLRLSLLTWITQLFEESLGSKIEGFNPKTLVISDESQAPGYFSILNAPSSEDKVVSMMQAAYFLQVFVATLSYHYGINFVTQPMVEIYKKKMRELAEAEIPPAQEASKEELAQRIREKLTAQTKFIEVVVYAHRHQDEIDALERYLQAQFEQKVIVFIGSDWNHHSYQAAAANQDTIFVILTQKDFLSQIEGIFGETLEQNIKDLRIITYATYETLKDKALYLAVEDDSAFGRRENDSPAPKRFNVAIAPIAEYESFQPVKLKVTFNNGKIAVEILQ
ncbi:MAG: hypothetical protein FJZ11_07115, partial [Candidatus Omnitrophica bacterium]|nr:hypothetical protein [Candidatus Omnitrophota bacterium]